MSCRLYEVPKTQFSLSTGSASHKKLIYHPLLPHRFQMRGGIHGQDASQHKLLSPAPFSASLWNSLDSAAARNLGKLGRRSCRTQSAPPPLPFRSYSIPIIPSVQGHSDGESSCIQTRVAATSREDKRQGHAPSSSSSSLSPSPVAEQRQNEVALLLEEAQEQLRVLVLAHRMQEESSAAPQVEARETVCFLNGGGSGSLSCIGPTQTQLLSPGQSHRDLGLSGQWEAAMWGPLAYNFNFTVFDKAWRSATAGGLWRCQNEK